MRNITRAYFITSTVLIVGCDPEPSVGKVPGQISYRQSPATEIERALAARLKERGIRVGVDTTGPEHYVAVVDFTECSVEPGDVELLLGFPRLHALSFSRSSISDRELEAIAKLTSLRRLWLNGTGLTDSSVDCIAKASFLSDLYVQDTKISEGSIQKLIKALPATRVHTSEPVPPENAILAVEMASSTGNLEQRSLTSVGIAGIDDEQHRRSENKPQIRRAARTPDGEFVSTSWR